MYDPNQRRDGAQPASASQTMANVQEYFRFAATVLGLVMMVIGLCYALRLFTMVRDGLGQAELATGPIAKWEQAFGGEKMDITANGATIHVAQILAISACGGSVILLVHIAIAFVYAGAKIVSLTTTDRQAIRRIILTAMGRPAPE